MFEYRGKDMIDALTLYLKLAAELPELIVAALNGWESTPYLMAAFGTFQRTVADMDSAAMSAASSFSIYPAMDRFPDGPSVQDRKRLNHLFYRLIVGFVDAAPSVITHLRNVVVGRVIRHHLRRASGEQLAIGAPAEEVEREVEELNI